MALKRVQDLATPCLLVERRALEANLSRMARFFDGRRARLRPHFKSHKCTHIAQLQLAAGNAVGITCATLGEAEALVAAGIGDVLLANQVVGADKLARLVELNRRARVRCCVDSPAQVEALAEAGRSGGVSLGMLVELDVGMGRCGVDAVEEVAELAWLACRLDGVVFDGLQAYEGHAVLVDDPAERAERARRALERTAAVRVALENGGTAVARLSSGGTGTYDITGAAGHVDEVQAGSYALMDARYRRVRPEFENALFVLATVLHAEGPRAVLDVGAKGCGGEFGPPELAGLAVQPEGRRLSEEHLLVDGLTAELREGQKLRLVPGHGCTTCNLYDRLQLVDGEEVLEVWPIEASGWRR
jgi:D-serine deaminase-like pyridoxal phosphate-dependent protein